MEGQGSGTGSVGVLEVIQEGTTSVHSEEQIAFTRMETCREESTKLMCIYKTDIMIGPDKPAITDSGCFKLVSFHQLHDIVYMYNTYMTLYIE